MTKTVRVSAGAAAIVHKCIAGPQPTLILYYAEFCPHCIAMKPEWARAKQTLETLKDLKVMEVEFHDQKYLPKTLPIVNGFPTLEVIQQGRVVREYDGDRSAESIVAFGRAAAALMPPTPRRKRATATTLAPKSFSAATKKKSKTKAT
jgi:thiol-disulfide isomerase/thioredoxin